MVSLAENRQPPKKKKKKKPAGPAPKKKFVSMFDGELDDDALAHIPSEDDDDLDLSDSDSDSDSDTDILMHKPLGMKTSKKQSRASSSSLKPMDAFKSTKPSKKPSPPPAAPVLPVRSSNRIRRRKEENKIASYKDIDDEAVDDDDTAEDVPTLRRPSRLKKPSKRRGKRGEVGAKSSQTGSSASAKAAAADEPAQVLDDEAFMASQESISSITLNIKPLKTRKRRRPSEDKQAEFARARKTLTEDERSIVRVAFYGLYPAPPSNLRAQSDFERKYGQEMSQKMAQKLWKYEFEQWSKRWWDFYSSFVDVAREKKIVT